MNELSVLKKLILDGVELTYGKLTLCNLQNYQSFRGNRKWQIYCSDRKIRDDKHKDGFYEVYINLDEAIKKFIELKGKITNRVR